MYLTATVRARHWSHAIVPALLLLLLLASPRPAEAQDASFTTAMRHLQAQSARTGVTPADLADVVVTDEVRTRHNGVTHLYLRQRYNGIDIVDANVNVNIGRDGRVLNSGGRFLSGLADRVNATAAALSVDQAVASAAQSLGLTLSEAVVVKERRADVSNGFVVSDGGVSESDIHAQLVYHLREDGKLQLAWEVHLDQWTAEAYWSLRVDASTGAVLAKDNLVIQDQFAVTDAREHPVHADAASKAMAGNSYNVFAWPLESPNHGGRSVVTNPADPVASPNGWHNDGALSYTITRGNNVWAYEDTGNTNTPGMSPDGGADLIFDFPLDFTKEPNTYEEAAITNLFYWNNIVHDVAYQYGFDEWSGNFQADNFGRGGLGGDFVHAEAQDGSGSNNANFLTPTDGIRPRMQMYQWTPAMGFQLKILIPSSLAGDYPLSGAVFGATWSKGGINGDIVAGVDSVNGTPGGTFFDGCEPLKNDVAGKIVLVNRGLCGFVVKVKNAQDAGAKAVLIANNSAADIITLGGTDPSITIPSGMITQALGNQIRAVLPGVNGTAARVVPFRDSDFDAGVIAHEYAHGISNRLTGGPNNVQCLRNAEQMGEGWSDFYGLLLTMDESALAQDRGVGSYVSFQGTDGLGIRPARYSPNLAVNNFTYADLPNAALTQPHGIGFLWNTMLWDLTWALIDEYGFDPDVYNGTGGNNIALQLVTDGLKLQPCSPGFVDGRDAILLADQINNGGANQDLIWEVFARRGLGWSASQGSPFNRNDGVAATDLPPAAPFAQNDPGNVTLVDQALTIDVLANDIVPADFSLAVTTAPASGTAVVNADHTITYTPNAAFNGADAFVYTLTDNEDSDTDVATVSIQVGEFPVIGVDPEAFAIAVEPDGAASQYIMVENNGSAGTTLNFQPFLNFLSGPWPPMAPAPLQADGEASSRRVGKNAPADIAPGQFSVRRVFDKTLGDVLGEVEGTPSLTSSAKEAAAGAETTQGASFGFGIGEINASIAYDDGNNFADSFVGFSSGASFAAANVFEVEGIENFVLTEVQSLFKTENRMEPVTIAVVRGGSNPDTGALELLQEFTGTSTNGAMFTVPLLAPLVFEPGEWFWVIFIYPTGVQFPQGIDNTSIDGESHSFYWTGAAWTGAGDILGNSVPDAFIIRALSQDRPLVSFAPDGGAGSVAAGASKQIVAIFTGENAVSGEYFAEIGIASNATEPMTTIDVALTVNGDADLAVDAGAIAFGDVVVNAFVGQWLEVTNEGTAILELSASTDNAAFSVEGPSWLAPGQTGYLHVAFWPQAEGAASATLTIATNDPDGDVTVALSGTGVPAPTPTVSPGSFDVQMLAGDVVTRTLTIGNTAGSDLHYDVSFSPAEAFLLDEGFNGETFPPAGWSVVNNTGGALAWESNDVTALPNLTEGDYQAATANSDAYAFEEYDTELVTPVLDVSGLKYVFLNYRANYQDYDTGFDRLDLDITTDGGATWTTVLSWDETHGNDGSNRRSFFVPLEGEDVWIELDPFIGGASEVQLRWHYYNPETFDWEWWAEIDDVRVFGAPVSAHTAAWSGTVAAGETKDVEIAFDATNFWNRLGHVDEIGDVDFDIIVSTNVPGMAPFEIPVNVDIGVLNVTTAAMDVHPNETFEVAIDVDNIDVAGAETYGFKLTFDDARLTPLSVRTDGTMSAGYTIETNLSIPGEVHVAAVSGASANLITGSGTLVKVVFKANEALGDAGLTFESFEIDEGQPLAHTDVGTVMLEPLYGDANLNTRVTAFDAGQVLKHVAHLIELGEVHLVSSEVSGNGTVTAFDAGLILKQVAQLISCFPVEAGCAASKTEAPASGVLAWSEPTQENGVLRVPLRLDNVSGAVTAVEVETSLDPALVELQAVTSQLPDGWQLEHQSLDDGTLRLAMAGMTPLSGGDLATLTVRLKNPSAQLSLQGAGFVNESALQRLSAVTVREVPTAFALGQNHPNPFNPATTITYQLAEPTDVTLEVFNMLGQRVQTLVHARQDAGHYTVTWNSQSDTGMAVSSGTYIYRLRAGSFVAQKIMVLLK